MALTNYKKRHLFVTVTFVRLIVLISLGLMISAPTSAQYFPKSYPINPSREHQLMVQLKKSSVDIVNLPLLLAIGNLYYNKPIKRIEELKKASFYTKQALKVSTQLNNEQGYNDAQLQMANILIENNQFKEAEAILPLVNDSTKINVLLSLSYQLLNRRIGFNEFDKFQAMQFAQEAKRLAIKNHDRLKEVWAMREIADVHASTGQFALAEKELNEVIKRHQLLGYRKLQYDYLELCDLNWLKGDYDQSLSFTLKALQCVESTKDSIAAGDAYYKMGMILRNTGQLEKSIENYKLSLMYYKEYKGSLASVSTAIIALTQGLIGRHEFAKALAFMLESYKKYPPQDLSEKQDMIGALGDCYLKLKKYSIAEKFFLKEFQMAKSSNSVFEFTYHRMGFFYVESRNYAKARPYLQNALKKLDPSISAQVRGHLFYMSYLADSALGNYLPAMHYLRENKRYDDTMNQQSKVKEMQRLNVQYETNKKNQQLKLLSKSEQLQEERAVRAELTRNITVATVLGLLFTIVFFQRMYKKNKRNSLIISQKNDQLGKLLAEKEWLLKEVHHRVKNNLHTVICLLELQAEFLQDDALKALENSQHRIYAMSLIHQKLYLSDDNRLINIAEYVKELVSYLKDSFRDLRNIIYQLDIEPLQLDIAVAIPLGLIINEAVSNSIKYAFPRQSAGTISISIQRDDKQISVRISDNGVGIDDDHPSLQGSMGLKLIRGLGNDINAVVNFENNYGTHISITFTPKIIL